MSALNLAGLGIVDLLDDLDVEASESRRESECVIAEQERLVI